MGSLAECHCLNVRWLTSRTIAIYDTYLKPVGITIQQYSILRSIIRTSPITVTDLAVKLQLDRTTLSRNVKILEDLRFVTHTIAKGRGKQLALTESGKETLRLAGVEWAKAQKQFADTLGPERLRQWNELLACLLK
jgi:DNA-binding MarR family transcriptional regulator